MNLNEFLDFKYGQDGNTRLRNMLASGLDPDAVLGKAGESALHVAARRRRLAAVKILIEHGAAINKRNAWGKTAYVHALRRGFTEISDYLREADCDVTMTDADRFAVAITENRLDVAKGMLDHNPDLVKTGNPGEDRLLADMAGRFALDAVAFLIDAGADLTAPGLDGGSPLHMTAWFGQPKQTQLLVNAGAPLECIDPINGSTPLGWAVHGSRFSGGASERTAVYVEIVEILLKAGAQRVYLNAQDDDSYWEWMLATASEEVRASLVAHFEH